MDDVIYEEFKGTGNSELILDRKLAEKRIFPSIDVQRSGTRREELLLEEGTLKMVWTMRRMLSAVGANEGIEILLNRLAKTQTNAEFLATLTKSLDSLTVAGEHPERVPRAARRLPRPSSPWYGSPRCRKPVVNGRSAAKKRTPARIRDPRTVRRSPVPAPPRARDRPHARRPYC